LRKARDVERVMSRTVHEIRNAIRAATGRFEREFAASFTKEELQAICETLEVDVATAGRPSTSQMRQQIRVGVGIAESVDTADDSTFRKADLQAIAEAVGASSEA
jgi:DNA-directed RNA polymerase specialized sigma subunit